MNQPDISTLVQRIEQLELNQSRLRILLSHAPEKHKAFDKACYVANLSFEQEAHVRQTILDFLDSDKEDINELLSSIEAIVRYTVDAKSLISGFKMRGTAPDRWKQIDPHNEC
ncbi:MULTISPECIES: hypothetical protein [Corynebacterium]|uniref:Uncharacterized protein n=4 Tax=Corynebacterium TaxID=1716 RepID=Q6NFD3_CORDI|nr:MULTISPECIES: hypothetical protein [Corynebacterium]OLN14877.1 hypothetical protein BUE64_10645 [Corynebacterium diphtheriae subsp. lausannense]ARB88040.1 hypothetical protein A6J36_06615 [Corynebacterium diphtheriae]KKA80415.1 hypothetical protein VN94_11345 [Corynebacterium diphtheriae]MBG9260208.1 hypothetical protein [Corynebacterium belfantii]MBG9266954.1 hypothetical protein [Corynebacterium belfantii]